MNIFTSLKLSLNNFVSLLLIVGLSNYTGQLMALERVLTQKLLVTSQVSTDTENLDESLEKLTPKNSFRPVRDSYDGDEFDGVVCGVAREISSPLAAAKAISREIATADITVSDAKLVGASEMPRSVNPVHAALVKAIFRNDLARVDAAVRAGADINALVGYDYDGLMQHQTCLMMAVRFKLPDVVKYLLSVPGIDVNKPDPIYGNTALIYATSAMISDDLEASRIDNAIALEIATLLLSKTAVSAINYKNSAGYTALDYVVWTDRHNDKLALAKLLLAKGADPITGLNEGTHAAIQLSVDDQETRARAIAALEVNLFRRTEDRALAQIAASPEWGGMSDAVRAILRAICERKLADVLVRKSAQARSLAATCKLIAELERVGSNNLARLRASSSASELFRGWNYPKTYYFL